jgi:hypothetical protein
VEEEKKVWKMKNLGLQAVKLVSIHSVRESCSKFSQTNCISKEVSELNNCGFLSTIHFSLEKNSSSK